MGSGPKSAQGLEDNENRHDKQQASFDQRRDRFDLSMPVVVPFIGGLSADANREIGHDRGANIEQRMQGVGQQPEASSHERSHELSSSEPHAGQDRVEGSLFFEVTHSNL
jgi:hypothetical protein